MIGVSYGTVGFSSGKRCVELQGVSGGRTRLGLCKYPYATPEIAPGDTGAGDSIGWANGKLHWTFGGTSSSKDVTMPIGAMVTIVFALDFTDMSLAVYARTPNGELYKATTLVGLPAGEWRPVMYDIKKNTRIFHNPHVPGFDNWSMVV